MNSPQGRVLIVVSVVLLVVAVVAYLQKRDAAPFRRLGRVGLDPGIYLFTSRTCSECGPAKQALVDHLGSEGFVEIPWETKREVFEELSIDAVPCTVLVKEGGSATAWPGSPLPMFSEVDP